MPVTYHTHPLYMKSVTLRSLLKTSEAIRMKTLQLFYQKGIMLERERGHYQAVDGIRGDVFGTEEQLRNPTYLVRKPYVGCRNVFTFQHPHFIDAKFLRKLELRITVDGTFTLWAPPPYVASYVRLRLNEWFLLLRDHAQLERSKHTEW